MYLQHRNGSRDHGGGKSEQGVHISPFSINAYSNRLGTIRHDSTQIDRFSIITKYACVVNRAKSS